VIVADVNADVGVNSVRQLNDQHGEGRCHFVRCDVTDKEQLRAAFVKAKELDGRVDILVNNAGILDESRVSEMVDVNVKGVIFGSELALEFMSKEKGGVGGVVVSTASAAGLFSAAFIPAYSATKHAVVGWTGSMGSDVHFKRHGVR
jgi:15-hydroxyprostaglandin dehydrogenase (NAD)